MFTTTVAGPLDTARRRTVRNQSALAASISCGASTTGTPPIITTGYLGSAICGNLLGWLPSNREPAARMGHTETAASQNAGPGCLVNRCSDRTADSDSGLAGQGRRKTACKPLPWLAP